MVPASETREWEVEEQEERWLGVCLPLDNSVRYAQLTSISPQRGPGWPVAGVVSSRLGSGAGAEPGAFFFPLSFDGSADGRIYVLDAGNARIQVFDFEGNYITQWGRKGSGPGEFDFGSGGIPEDFAGSVAVDSEGFIYVADVGNKRIQKFAP